MLADYVAPMAVECAEMQDDTAADELEWLAIEASAMRFGAYLVPAPDGTGRGPVAYWLGPKPSKRMHPRAYRVPGEGTPLFRRAANPDQAELALQDTPASYTRPQLGPWPHKTVSAAILYGHVKELRYNVTRGEWR